MPQKIRHCFSALSAVLCMRAMLCRRDISALSVNRRKRDLFGYGKRFFIMPQITETNSVVKAVWYGTMIWKDIDSTKGMEIQERGML